MDDERESLKDERYSLYFLLNSDEEQLQLDWCPCGDLVSSSFPSSPTYSWPSSSPATRSQSASPTPATAASTSTTAFAPPRSCFQQDWGSSQPYYYHTYQSGGISTVDEVATQAGRVKSLLQVHEKLESARKAPHHQHHAQECSPLPPTDSSEPPRPSTSSSTSSSSPSKRRSQQRSPSAASSAPAYSLSSPTALPHLPGQSSFLYCKKKITRKQSKKRRTPERRTVFYTCRVFEDGRQLHYTRDNKGLPRVPSSLPSTPSSSSRTTRSAPSSPGTRP